MPETVKERRAKGSEIAGGIIGCVLLFLLASILFFSDENVLGWIAVVIALGVLVDGFSSRETVACPNCNHRFDTIGLHDNWLLCPSCEKYLEIKKPENGSRFGQVTILNDNNYVCEDLIFQVKVPEGNYFPTFPPGCCICGKKAINHGVASNSKTSYGPVRGEIIKFTIYDIPYCDEHYLEYTKKNSVGVALIPRSDDSKLIKDPQNGGWHILAFCSYPYFRAFCRLNHW